MKGGWKSYFGIHLCVSALICGCIAVVAGAEPYRFDDIRLGASFVRLAHELDFRDIHAAVAEQQDRKASKPDLGRRGYSCARRDDPHADVTCVSHEERVGGAETREIRLHFLDGLLQQFSISAEIRRFDAVMDAVGAQNGASRVDGSTSPPLYRWDNGESKIMAYSGKDLVFVAFEPGRLPGRSQAQGQWSARQRVPLTAQITFRTRAVGAGCFGEYHHDRHAARVRLARGRSEIVCPGEASLGVSRRSRQSEQC